MVWDVWKPPGVPILGSYLPITDVRVVRLNSERVYGFAQGKPFNVKNKGEHFFVDGVHYTCTWRDT